MSSSFRNRHRRLNLENLENRKLMAGDVSVSMFGGVLDIDGDSAANAVQITKLANGNLEVYGLSAPGGLTKINGGYSPFTIDADVVDHIDINMGDGDDAAYLPFSSQTHLPGNLNIRMQGGDDYVMIEKMSVGGSASISTDRSTGGPYQIGADYAGGDDVVEISDSTWADLDIHTRGGNDSVLFDHSYTPTGYPLWNVFQTLDVYTEGGDDEIALNNVFAAEHISVLSGSGQDTINADRIAAYSQYVYLDSGGDADEVNVSNISMYWNNQTDSYASNPDADFYVFTGSGNDVLTMTDVTVVTGSLYVMTDAGHDTVELENLTVRDQLFASLGSGNDKLTISNTSAAEAILEGGTHNRFGGDILGLNNTDFDSTTKTGWEQYLYWLPLPRPRG